MWLACVIFRDTQVHTLQQNVSVHLGTKAGVKMKSMLFYPRLRSFSHLAKEIAHTPGRNLTEATPITQLLVGLLDPEPPFVTMRCIILKVTYYTSFTQFDTVPRGLNEMHSYLHTNKPGRLPN